MIETLDEVVEQIAAWPGVCGVEYANFAHSEECKPPDHCCRCCWMANLKARVRTAVEIDILLSALKEKLSA